MLLLDCGVLGMGQGTIPWVEGEGGQECATRTHILIYFLYIIYIYVNIVSFGGGSTSSTFM